MSFKKILADQLMPTRTGSVDPKKFPEELFELYSVPSFDNGAPELIKGAEIGSTKQIVLPGDVLLSKIVPHIRRSWVVGPEKGQRIIASSEWIVFRSEEVFPEYLVHLLVSDSFHRRFLNTTAGIGGSLVRARPQLVRQIEFNIPSLPEQKRIAAILDKADAIRRKREKTIALSNSLNRSVYIDLFGNPDINSKKFPTKFLSDKEICSRVTVGYVGTMAKEYVSTGVPFLRSLNIKRGKISLKNIKYISEDFNLKINKSSLSPGDVVVVRTGKPGKTAIIPQELPEANCSDLIVMTPKNKLLSTYLCETLNIMLGDKINLAGTSGAIQKHFNIKRAKELSIPVPPEELLQKYSKYMSLIDSLLSNISFENIESNNLFASLQQRAFNGEV